MRFKVNDKVSDDEYGDGVVIRLEPDHVIVVRFKSNRVGLRAYLVDEQAYLQLVSRPAPIKWKSKLVWIVILLLFAFAVKAKDCDTCRRLDRHEATLPRNYYYPDQIWKRTRESYNYSIKERQDSPVQVYRGSMPPVRHGRDNKR